MSILATIKEKAYAANFNGGFHLDSAETTELNSALADYAEMTDNLESHYEELKEYLDDEYSEINETEVLLGVSYRLVEANAKLPEHFAIAFTEALNAVQKKINEIRKGNQAMSEIAGKIDHEIYNNGLHG